MSEEQKSSTPVVSKVLSSLPLKEVFAALWARQPGADPVRKVSIVPRGRALGVTLSTPDSE